MRAVWLLGLAACGRVGFDTHGDAGSLRVPREGNVAFVTSTLHVPGILGSLDAGDAICRMRAAEAGLPGTFIAYLSTSASNIVDRLAVARGWYRLDGEPVVDTADDLAMGRMIHPMRVDERGLDLGDTYVNYAATGTFAGQKNQNCVDFTDLSDMTEVGFPQFAGGGFSGTNNQSCATPAYLYCLQIDYSHPVVVTRAQGRVAFVSTEGWAPTAGIAAADALCDADAMAAGVPGPFRALLPGSSASAASRFDAGGPPWVTTEGVLLAPTATAMLAGSVLAPLNREATGAVTEGFAMSGQNTPSTFDAPDPQRTCDGWSNAGGGSEKGYVSATGVAWLNYTSDTCAGPVRVYCLHL